MDIRIHLQQALKPFPLRITGSKSETNRLLLLKALYPGITIENLSHSDDSDAMAMALSSKNNVIDIHHAGTAMRFLTAYFALQEGREVILTGSQRMKERPIDILVDALHTLGAQIEYTEKEGYPPIRITGKKLTSGKISIQANISSQYITALLLIGGKLQNGLELTLEGEITSLPYIKMTLGLLEKAGIETTFNGNIISVLPFNLQSAICNLQSFTVESDWSSASYFYSIVALAEEGTKITLSSYKENSLQGDSALTGIYKQLGVKTEFNGDTMTLTKTQNPKPKTLNLKLNDTPDIAQTIAVTCFGLGVSCCLTGLHTLKIKETDRLEALKIELQKLDANIIITDSSLQIAKRHKSEASSLSFETPIAIGGGEGFLKSRGEANPERNINTYNDHRMAMAFAPLAVMMPIVIKDAEVVSKSYPGFWDDLESLGFSIEKL